MVDILQKAHSEDRLLSWILVGTILMLLFRVTILLQLFDDTHFLVTGYKYAVAILFGFGLRTVCKRSFVFILKAYFLFCVLYVAQVLLFPENKEYIDKDMFYTLVVCMPFLVYMYSIKDYAVLMDTFRQAIPIALVLNFTYCYMVFKNGMTGESNAYNMSAGFTFMPFVLIAFSLYFRENSLRYLIFGMLISLGILMVGSRGPILWIALYVLWKLMKKLSIAMRTILCVLVGIVVLFFNDFMLWLNGLLESYGIYSRTLFLLANGLTEGAGRWELYEQGIQIISDNWFTGAGIGCDRALNSYIHNFFLEIWMDFGIILGTLVMCLFFNFVWKAFRKANDTQSQSLELFMFIGYMPLMLSGSYYTDFHFYIFMGVVLGVLSRHAVHRKYQSNI